MGTMQIWKFSSMDIGESAGIDEASITIVSAKFRGTAGHASGVYMMATGCWSHYMHDVSFSVSYAELT